MDPNTGRLRALSEDECSVLSMMQKSGTAEKDIPEELKGLEPLPDKLQEEAEKELAGRKEAFVDLKADTPLANWARKRRKTSTAKMKKKRRKMAQQSRKINRKKW